MRQKSDGDKWREWRAAGMAPNCGVREIQETVREDKRAWLLEGLGMGAVVGIGEEAVCNRRRRMGRLLMEENGTAMIGDGVMAKVTGVAEVERTRGILGQHFKGSPE